MTVLVMGHRKYDGKLMQLLGGKHVRELGEDEASLLDVRDNSSVQEPSVEESSCLLSMGMSLVVI
jgi:hypothetical protein